MPRIDLSFLRDDPTEKSAKARLLIEPLAPLSMNTTVPGKHYQTALNPPIRQIYGMLENALGLHFGWGDDYKIRQDIANDAAADVRVSYRDKRDFQPLIAQYVDLEPVQYPARETYDDLQWSHKWRDSAQTRNGAMHHDWRATGDEPERYGYGKTLVQREYVVAEGRWIYAAQTTPMTLATLQEALTDPQGPLYLGNNDGWVHAMLELTQ